MGQNKKFYLQESDDSNMNRSPIDGSMPYGGFLRNMIYPEFYAGSLFFLDRPQITNSQVSQLSPQDNIDSNNLKNKS